MCDFSRLPAWEVWLFIFFLRGGFISYWTVHWHNTLSRPPGFTVQTAEPQAPWNNFCHADEILTRLPLVPLASLCHADWTKSRWRFRWPPARTVVLNWPQVCRDASYKGSCVRLVSMWVIALFFLICMFDLLLEVLFICILFREKCKVDWVLWRLFTVGCVCLHYCSHALRWGLCRCLCICPFWKAVLLFMFFCKMSYLSHSTFVFFYISMHRFYFVYKCNC